MIIESTSNSTIKELAKLAHKKDRDAKNMFLVEGEHLLQEAKQAGVLLRVFQRSDLDRFDFDDVTLCSQAVLNKLSTQKSDAKYIGLCKMMKHKSRNKWLPFLGQTNFNFGSPSNSWQYGNTHSLRLLFWDRSNHLFKRLCRSLWTKNDSIDTRRFVPCFFT